MRSAVNTKPKKITQQLLKAARYGVVVISLSAVFSVALADPTGLVSVGRYLTVDSQPQNEQMDLLAVMIQVHFLPKIKTVGDAIDDLLRYSGYSLIEEQQQSVDLKNTLGKPLPFVNRNLGPVTLRQALAVLIGPAFHLVADPLHRTIHFELNPEFTTVSQ